jgi:bifunctional UDP-N-acetylglucosamine pyrophosphorylase/glucosamine-1-phosphate N-acetyltransferase
MKALILAAGRGTRMRHLTDDRPKPLVEIGDRTFLDHVIESLGRAGINEIGIVVGYRKEKIKDHLNGMSNISFIEQGEQLGTGHAVNVAKRWSAGEDFIVLMGDNLYSPKDIERLLRRDGLCYVAGHEHQTPEKFGVLMIDGEFLKGIIEKPSNPPSNLINTGLYKFTSEIFNALDKIDKSERGEYEITDAINLLCRERKVKFVKIMDYWLNLGCPEDVSEINKFLSEDRHD